VFFGRKCLGRSALQSSLRAADLLAGPFRDKLNAATMLCQSKNVFQAEIDAACELIDFFQVQRAVHDDKFIAEQPESLPGTWNRLQYRPLEGFVFAITPFNFTSIAANLCAAPAMMGNVVVWKPAESQIYSAKIIMDLFKAAGLPDGVMNMVTARGSVAGEVVFNHQRFCWFALYGLHWRVPKSMETNREQHPHCIVLILRVVGETGGKDFVFAHESCCCC
jgi:1-pyrroline-5-carboxylate dehydrogenase